jgi:signal transduction histidine kinase
VNVTDILRSVRDTAAAKIESDRLTLEIDCPPETGTVIADEARLTKAIYNLLWNTVMFHSSGGVITLRARRRSRDVTVEVDDSSGLVIEDEPEQIYDTFEHGDPYVRRTGAGLGLALTRSLVELHGGALDMTSEPGRGMRAIVRFPIAGPTLDAAKARAAE